MSALRLAILNGPNLTRLGTRQPEVYGRTDWADLQRQWREWGREHDCGIRIEQTDGEGGLVGLIHAAEVDCAGIVLNAAAYTHTSVAVRDAVLAVSIPVVEVHLSNPAAREEFRRRNLLADVVAGSVQGFGAASYLLALEGLRTILSRA